MVFDVKNLLQIRLSGSVLEDVHQTVCKPVYSNSNLFQTVWSKFSLNSLTRNSLGYFTNLVVLNSFEQVLNCLDAKQFPCLTMYFRCDVEFGFASQKKHFFY